MRTADAADKEPWTPRYFFWKGGTRLRRSYTTSNRVAKVWPHQTNHGNIFIVQERTIFPQYLILGTGLKGPRGRIFAAQSKTRKILWKFRSQSKPRCNKIECRFERQKRFVKFPEPIQRKFHFRYPVRTTQNKSKEKQTDTDAKISPPPRFGGPTH